MNAVLSLCRACTVVIFASLLHLSPRLHRPLNYLSARAPASALPHPLPMPLHDPHPIPCLCITSSPSPAFALSLPAFALTSETLPASTLPSPFCFLSYSSPAFSWLYISQFTLIPSASFAFLLSNSPANLQSSCPFPLLSSHCEFLSLLPLLRPIPTPSPLLPSLPLPPPHSFL